MDTTVPDIIFDENGVCNYCKLHDIVEEQNQLNESRRQMLQYLVNEIKRKGKDKEYDCIVGVSGGIDSTYTLYTTKKLGLRPLAVHFDNGWDSEIAVSNIKNATSKLNIDLYTYVVDWEEFKDIQIAFLKASVPEAEIPTDQGIKPVLFRAASQEGIQYVVHGHSFRTEGKIPPLWSYGDSRYVKSVYKKFGKMKKLKTYPHYNVFDLLYYVFLKRIKLIRLLYYIDYRKDVAKNIIEKELGWRTCGGKHYESIYTRFVHSYLLPKKFNIDKRKVHFSEQIRSGQVTREGALEKIKEKPISEEQSKEDKDYVIKKLGLTEKEFEAILSAEPKTFMDYPTYFGIIKKFRVPIKLAYRLVSPTTPPILNLLDNK